MFGWEHNGTNCGRLERAVLFLFLFLPPYPCRPLTQRRVSFAWVVVTSVLCCLTLWYLCLVQICFRDLYAFCLFFFEGGLGSNRYEEEANFIRIHKA